MLIFNISASFYGQCLVCFDGQVLACFDGWTIAGGDATVFLEVIGTIIGDNFSSHIISIGVFIPSQCLGVIRIREGRALTRFFIEENFSDFNFTRRGSQAIRNGYGTIEQTCFTFIVELPCQGIQGFFDSFFIIGIDVIGD